MIPGQPKVGDKFYQEIAPKVAMDRVEVVSTDETVKTPAGTFQHCSECGFAVLRFWMRRLSRAESFGGPAPEVCEFSQ